LLQLRDRLRQLPDIQQGDPEVLVRFGRWLQPQRGFVVDQSFGGPALKQQRRSQARMRRHVIRIDLQRLLEPMSTASGSRSARR
jgi:hypothetical protein